MVELAEPVRARASWRRQVAAQRTPVLVSRLTVGDPRKDHALARLAAQVWDRLGEGRWVSRCGSGCNGDAVHLGEF